MIDFGKNLGLETQQDAIGNIIIKKPASKGMEEQKTIILQGHLDMVHQKIQILFLILIRKELRC